MSNTRQRARTKTKNLFMKCIRSTLSRPEQLTVSQWASKYRELDESSSLPGKWSNNITPYLTEIMDCFNDPYIQFINFVKGTQVGGTEALINATGWIITKNPSPTMLVYPTDDLAKDISNDRLKPVYRATPEIAKRFLRTKSSEMNLRFKGMNIYLRSGGSPAKLASKPIKFLIFDEIDKMSGATKREASPYNLATERTKTYKFSRKIFTISTPTYRENYIWRFHEAADEQRYYYVPCPHCGEYIIFKWEQIKFASNEDGALTNRERASTAMYYCQECGAAISDRQKPNMLKHGQWRDIKGTNKGKATRVSYHLSALYSFFVSWSDVAFEYLQSRDDPEEYQNFVNSWLAEPWEDTKLKVSGDLVKERQAEEAEGVVPEWAVFLTAGVDVQESSVYYDIVAWGEGLTSQSILHGNVSSLADLEPYMNTSYARENGERLYIELWLIDSGYQADEVYEFCLLHEDAVPCKGVARRSNDNFRRSQINKPGRGYNGMSLILVDGSKYKDMIAARLNRPNGKGSCMVHANVDDDYCQQLTNEHKIAEGTGRNRKLVWKPKTRHANNHFLDCRVYASAAADIRGVRALGRQYETEDPAPQPTPKKKNSWLYGY